MNLFLCDVFVTVSRRGTLNSLIFTKAWSKQAWIPFVSSSLYFWKSVFSFRVDSNLKWTVSWLRAFLWCISQTSRDQVNSRRVRAHEKNSGGAVRRLGTIIQSIFCAQSGASIRLTVWKWPGESRYSGVFPPELEKLSSLLFSRPDWPPFGLRGCGWHCLDCFADCTDCTEWVR